MDYTMEEQKIQIGENKKEAQSDNIAKAIYKLSECKIVIEPSYVPKYLKEENEIIAWYERWAREMQEFFRDHRIQDVNSVYADIVRIKVCSKCKDTYEPTLIDGVLCCASCGKPTL